jgi:hypothetical protein
MVQKRKKDVFMDKEELERSKMEYFARLNITNPGLKDSAKEIFWLKEKRRLKSSHRNQRLPQPINLAKIRKFNLAILNAEKELSKNGIKLKKSSYDAFSEPIRNNEFKEFFTRVHNLIFSRKKTKSWLLTLMSEKKLLKFSIEQIVIDNQETFNGYEDIVERSKKNLSTFTKIK